MVRSTAANIERATLKKAAVSTVPSWAKAKAYQWSIVESDEDSTRHVSEASSSTIIGSSMAKHSSTTSLPHTINSTATGTSTSQSWSIFTTMSNVSTVSECLSKFNHPVYKTAPAPTLEPIQGSYHSLDQKSHHRQALEGVQDKRDCTCTCPQHEYSSHHQPRRTRLSTRSKKRQQKYSLELARGYPTGECISSSGPPPVTIWDEKDPADVLFQGRRLSISTNTAFNIEAFKMFLTSPLFSSILKSLIVLAATLLVIISIHAIIALHRDLTFEKDANPFSNATASLIITIILSVFTIVYSCFTIFLDSRRPPEGLDSSNSKPLTVIFSEILMSIFWAQVLSVTIYIYTWTFGCTMAGKRQLERVWHQNQSFPDHVVERLCRHEGAMLGLEIFLVMLLIFNFYTHLAQNFQFIRAVSR
ncbi:hypothetical protein BX616_001706 [Lobosporangium transversale]|uniref:Uncharacterized protein n=1 Tax=Lobosporangium transversale TaxID=64571 RepID=A0A1Y2GLJ1_9FUNG|nr:hypothetical protein BCR41DRAFT_422639 [Lobosporangium transversale]KAF9917178.1 hypothetical protein BX616_001706 [Lobosporangium transversale]ORZ14410.1 hypothetical protein BCR41DRAFT_422639 [Lobosporangium transversale]|eukprot:XP_021880888.1 hypothetical protein BCR41DRAFT_422639 [Lobosporangium transversale]